MGVEMIRRVFVVVMLLFFLSCGDGEETKAPEGNGGDPTEEGEGNNPYPPGSTAAECGDKGLMYNWLQGECFEDFKLVDWECNDENVRKNADLEFSTGLTVRYEERLEEGYSPRYCGQSDTMIQMMIEKPNEGSTETVSGASLPRKIDAKDHVKSLGYAGDWSHDGCDLPFVTPNKKTVKIEGLSIEEEIKYYDDDQCQNLFLTVTKKGTYTYQNLDEGRSQFSITWESYKMLKTDALPSGEVIVCSAITLTDDVEADVLMTKGCFDDADASISTLAIRREMGIDNDKFYMSAEPSFLGSSVAAEKAEDWTKALEYVASVNKYEEYKAVEE